MGNYGAQIRVGHSVKKGGSIYVNSPITSSKQRKGKILKQLSKIECVGEFTCDAAVNILMTIGTTEGKLSKVQKRGEYQIKIKPKKDTIMCIGEFTCYGAVDVLMAIGTTGGKLNEYQSKFVRFEEQPPTKTKAVPKARGETQSKIRSMFINSFYFF